MASEAKIKANRRAVDGPHPLFPIDASITFDRFVHHMSVLTRYEASIERRLSRAIALLERFQGQRWRRDERAREPREDRLRLPAARGPQES